MYNILEIPKDCFVAFGERCNKYDADWIKSFKEKTFDKLEDLRGESWTDVVFYILPCEEKHCEQIELTLLD